MGILKSDSPIKQAKLVEQENWFLSNELIKSKFSTVKNR